MKHKNEKQDKKLIKKMVHKALDKPCKAKKPKKKK
jgi:hypothetical protein